MDPNSQYDYNQQQPLMQQQQPDQYNQNYNQQYQYQGTPDYNQQYQQPQQQWQAQPGVNNNSYAMQQPQGLPEAYPDGPTGAPPQQQQSAYPTAAPEDIRQQSKGFGLPQQIEEQQHAYIKKVFAIVAIQFSFSTAMCILASLPGFSAFAWWCASPAPFIISMVVTVVVAILIFCTPLAKKVPINFALLALFTVAETIIFCAMCGWLNPGDVMVACGVVWAAASSLCITALVVPITAKLVRALIIGLLIGCMLQLFAVIGLCFCSWQNYNFYYCLWYTLGFMIAGLCIFVDVIIIQIQGKVAPDDYVRGALMLYIDLMRLLYYALIMCAGKR